MDKKSQKKPTFNPTAANINLLWASLFIEELLRHDIRDFCIAPGSRSTPLTLAVSAHEDVNTHTHFDERGLGFLALGIALAGRKPVVIITTSGTAVANLYPAVIEARQSNVPLIILSADRPPELLDCGANQAIDQQQIFAGYPIFFKHIPSPTLDIPAAYLLTAIDQGLNKQANTPAPIHFNIAFPEPLYPDAQYCDYQAYLAPLEKWQTSNRPFTCYPPSHKLCNLNSSYQVTAEKVLIIAGRLTDQHDRQAIAQFAQTHHYPLLSDIQSSLSAGNLCYYDLLLSNPDFTRQLARADLIIQFGDKLISKRLNQFIARFKGQYWLIQSGDQCIDPNRILSMRIDCNAQQWIAAHPPSFSVRNKNWLYTLAGYNDQLSRQIIEPLFTDNALSEINLVRSLDKLSAKNSPLFIGNSMPIRICDMFMRQHQAQIYSNRGASGIDGLLATAIGVAKASRKVTTLLIGDTSFLYDLNSLALLKQLSQPFIIIVINNDGGSIFNLLPVPAQQKQDFYQLPHGLNFAQSCKQFSIDYYQPKQLDEFKANYKSAAENTLSLIEVCTKNDQTYKQLEQLKEQIQDATF